MIYKQTPLADWKGRSEPKSTRGDCQQIIKLLSDRLSIPPFYHIPRNQDGDKSKHQPQSTPLWPWAEEAERGISHSVQRPSLISFSFRLSPVPALVLLVLTHTLLPLTNFRGWVARYSFHQSFRRFWCLLRTGIDFGFSESISFAPKVAVVFFTPDPALIFGDGLPADLARPFLFYISLDEVQGLIIKVKNIWDKWITRKETPPKRGDFGFQVASTFYHNSRETTYFVPSGLGPS